MKNITFYSNGMNMAFENGERIRLAQKPWIIVFAEYLSSIRIDPTEVRFMMPNGQTAEIFKNKDNEFNFDLDWTD